MKFLVFVMWVSLVWEESSVDSSINFYIVVACFFIFLNYKEYGVNCYYVDFDSFFYNLFIVNKELI